MTSQRLVEDFARYLFGRDHGEPIPPNWRVPDYAMNEAAVFLAGELGQRLQREFYDRGYRDGCNDTGLRAEVADRANVEADLRAQLAGTRARAEVLDRQFDAFQLALIDALPDAEPDWEPAEIVAAVRGLAGEVCSDCGLWHRAPDVS